MALEVGEEACHLWIQPPVLATDFLLSCTACADLLGLSASVAMCRAMFLPNQTEGRSRDTGYDSGGWEMEVSSGDFMVKSKPLRSVAGSPEPL